MSAQVVDKIYLFEDFRLIASQLQAQKKGIITGTSWQMLTGKYW